MAGDPAFWPNLASPASIPARLLEIQPERPESGVVSPESGDIYWTSPDSSLICQIPAPTGSESDLSKFGNSQLLERKSRLHLLSTENDLRF
jgi:hypothetical protein